MNVIKNVPRANDSDMGGHNSKYWAKYSQGMFDRVMRVERNVIDRYYHNFIINPSDHVGQRPW